MIHWESRGDPAAPPLLLVMGLAVSSRAWDRLPEIMSAKFRVLTFDNRGTGRSQRGGIAYRMTQLAEDAVSVLDAAGAAQAHVFGISMGGMIAQELTLRHPERVRTLALGCTLACWRTARRPSLRTVVDLLMLNLGFRTRERLGRLLVSPEWHSRQPQAIVDWIRRAERTTPRYAVAQMLAVRGHACEERLTQIRAPTLVMTGTADRLIPPENSRLIARLIPGARLLEFPGAGHCFPLEKEEETVRALTEHFCS